MKCLHSFAIISAVLTLLSCSNSGSSTPSDLHHVTKFVSVWMAFDTCYYEPTQKVYISCSLDGTIQVYDSGLESLLAEIGNLEHPMALYEHPTTNTVSCSHQSANVNMQDYIIIKRRCHLCN